MLVIISDRTVIQHFVVHSNGSLQRICVALHVMPPVRRTDLVNNLYNANNVIDSAALIAHYPDTDEPRWFVYTICVRGLLNSLYVISNLTLFCPFSFLQQLNTIYSSLLLKHIHVYEVYKLLR